MKNYEVHFNRINIIELTKVSEQTFIHLPTNNKFQALGNELRDPQNQKKEVKDCKLN